MVMQCRVCVKVSERLSMGEGEGCGEGRVKQKECARERENTRFKVKSREMVRGRARWWLDARRKKEMVRV